jgi:hypothetical protein
MCIFLSCQLMSRHPITLSLSRSIARMTAQIGLSLTYNVSSSRAITFISNSSTHSSCFLSLYPSHALWQGWLPKLGWPLSNALSAIRQEWYIRSCNMCILFCILASTLLTLFLVVYRLKMYWNSRHVVHDVDQTACRIGRMQSHLLVSGFVKMHPIVPSASCSLFRW